MKKVKVIPRIDKGVVLKSNKLYALIGDEYNNTFDIVYINKLKLSFLAAHYKDPENISGCSNGVFYFENQHRNQIYSWIKHGEWSFATPLEIKDIATTFELCKRNGFAREILSLEKIGLGSSGLVSKIK